MEFYKWAAPIVAISIGALLAMPPARQLLLRVYLQAFIARLYLLAARFSRGFVPQQKRGLFPVITQADLPNMIGAEWLTNELRQQCIIPVAESVSTVSIEGLSANRGLTAAIVRVVALTSNNTRHTFILKMTKDATLKDTVNNILSSKYREATVYYKLGPQPYMPRMVASYMSQFTGTCLMLMEDLGKQDTIGVNLLLGNQIWGVPEGTPSLPKGDVLKQVFLAAAEMQASRWQDAKFNSQPWLKGVDWYNGRGRGSWELAVQTATDAWRDFKASDLYKEVKFDPKFVRIMDFAATNSTWQRMQQEIRSETITLIHGDFHGSNMLWRLQQHHQHPVVLLDWSEVGLGEPATEVSQMMISDVKPEERRRHEHQLLRAYYDRLMELGVPAASFSFETCKQQYARAGVEKWLWMMGLLCSYRMFALPASALQYFHDQIISFINDHPVPGDVYIYKPFVTVLLG